MEITLLFYSISGVHVFYIAPLGGGQKYKLLVGWGKNMMIHKEKCESKGEVVENRGNVEILTVLWGKNIILEKGGVAKISYFREIYTPGLLIKIDPQTLNND